MGGLEARRREQSRTFGPGIGDERNDSDIDEAGVGHQPAYLFVSKTEPHMPHLLSVALAFVGHHVDEQHPSSRLEDARHFGQRHRWIRHVVQHQHQRRDVEAAIVNRQRLEVAAPKIDIVGNADARPRRLEHLRRGVNGDDPGDERSQRGTDVAGATAKVAHDRARIGERPQGRQMETIAKQIVTEAVPLPGGRRKNS